MPELTRRRYKERADCCGSASSGRATLSRARPLALVSRFQVPTPIAARIQRSRVPFLGQAHAIRRQRCPSRFVECKAGAHQVAKASLTRDVAVPRWALDEQLTEDADGTWRQLKLARDH